MNFKIRVAQLNIAISARYALTERICQPYLCESDDLRLDFSVFATSAQIAAKKREMSVDVTDEMAECICIHENLALRLLAYDAFVMHAALISYRGRGYAVCAPRGVGKTTHAKLWVDLYGDDVRIINGDKPIIRLQKDGTFMAYGTPWCGKEGYGENAGVPLDGICLLSRAECNRILPVDDQTYVTSIIGQTVFPPERQSMARGATLLARMIRTVPAVAGQCLPDLAAAQMVSVALLGCRKEQK